METRKGLEWRDEEMTPRDYSKANTFLSFLYLFLIFLRTMLQKVIYFLVTFYKKLLLVA